ncbi:hypothetical protein LCGC14_1848670 [marine sediment metagenome]|uniref:DNA (cytosine-5-)-methyltransferase n=1 Tax=marine sediment metagenome TaxID=412755 RepID=A0A0F9JA92_9ZZZZ
MPTAGSLFSGIGGLDLGLERAGWEVKWQVEINEWCRKILTKHWPDVPKYGDIKEASGEELEAVDLIAGGFPCQPVSLAGRRKAEADPRWLWPEFLRIVSEVRPQYVLVENVPGLLHRGMAEVIGDLSSCRYDAEWGFLSAADVGAPHLRQRVFVVAHTQGLTGQDGPAEAERQRGLAGSGDTDAYSDSQSPFRTPITREERNPWSVEPDVGRVAHGVPSRVDRLRGLGNAVVPQVAEWIGQRILEESLLGESDG